MLSQLHSLAFSRECTPPPLSYGFGLGLFKVDTLDSTFLFRGVVDQGVALAFCTSMLEHRRCFHFVIDCIVCVCEESRRDRLPSSSHPHSKVHSLVDAQARQHAHDLRCRFFLTDCEFFSFRNRYHVASGHPMKSLLLSGSQSKLRSPSHAHTLSHRTKHDNATHAKPSSDAQVFYFLFGRTAGTVVRHPMQWLLKCRCWEQGTSLASTGGTCGSHLHRSVSDEDDAWARRTVEEQIRDTVEILRRETKRARRRGKTIATHGSAVS